MEPWKLYRQTADEKPWKAYAKPAAPDPMLHIDPTEGMSIAEKYMAGIGKSLYDTARGAGQIVGLVSGKDMADTNRLDAPLMNTTAGKLGNVTGMIGQTLLPGGVLKGVGALANAPKLVSAGNMLLNPASYKGAAAVGAGFGMLQPVEGNSASDVALGKLTGAGGGAVGGVVGQGIGRAIGATAQAAKALIDPLTEKGQQRIVGRTLERFAGDPNSIYRAAEYSSAIPGVKPTLAEAALDPGISGLQLSVMNADPAAKSLIVNQGINNNAALLDALRAISRDDAARAAAVDARDSVANTLYGNAFNADKMRSGLGKDYADVTLVALKAKDAVAQGGLMLGGKGVNVSKFQPDDLATNGLRELAKRPGFQSAVNQARELAANKGVMLKDPLQSLEGLHYVKLALDDMSSGPVAATSLGRNAQAAYGDMRNLLAQELEKVSPLYANARNVYAQMSQPINQMDVGAELYNKLAPALVDQSGVATRLAPGSYAQALRNSEALVKKATGRDSTSLADIMSPEQMRAINGVGADIGRKNAADDMAKTLGSTTAQNLAAQNLLRRVLGPLGLPDGALESQFLGGVSKAIAAPYKLTGSEQEIASKLAQSMSDPRIARSMVMEANKQGVAKKLSGALLKGGLLMQYPGMYIGGTSSGLLSQQ